MKFHEFPSINYNELTQAEVEFVLNDRISALNRITTAVSAMGALTLEDAQILLKIIENDTETIRTLFAKMGYDV